MMGAIIGDIIGSKYEFNNIKTKNFPLFGKDCRFTDDTVMTAAVALGIMRGGRDIDFITSMKELGRHYPNAGYGGRFSRWLKSDDDQPYNSYGNGAAMRVSPCAWCGYDGQLFAIRATAVTHNHSESIRAALAVSYAIRLCLDGVGKKRVRSEISSIYKYDLYKTLNEIRPTYSFDETCQGSVPQAITAFLESDGFEDAIRNAVSIGGDSDTIAAITGSIAEAAYGIPEDIMDRAWTYLDEPLKDICRDFRKYVRSKG